MLFQGSVLGSLLSSHRRVLANGVEKLLAYPRGLLVDGVHVELGDLSRERPVFLGLVLIHWKIDNFS